MTPRSMVLIILDGFGYRSQTTHNAIAAAHTPVWDHLWQAYPHLLIQGSGHYVGLPDNQMGNSEVGHLNIGAGRVVYQELTRIDQAIETATFAQHPILQTTFQQLREKQRALHVMGLLSSGGVHSHENHILALLKLAHAQGIKDIYLHAFLDGRDTPPQSAEASLAKIMQLPGIKIASLMGRYYAMDRDNRWERTEYAYTALTSGSAEFYAADPLQGLQQAYARGETDEFVQPTLIADNAKNVVRIEDGDAIIFMNFRADRARQLTQAFTDQHFSGFSRKKIPALSHFITLTKYAENLPVEVLFPPQSLQNVLGEYIAAHGFKQFRIAETEKYAHVTYFFNGGHEKPFAGEARILIPSPRVATYDLQPEMSAQEITAALVTAITAQKYTLLVCNFANADMVGHTGNFSATVTAIETLDKCLGKILHAVKENGAEMLITADHGNAECMYDDQTQQPHTAHTSDPVPLVYVGRPVQEIATSGCLADIAPTLLSLLDLPIPTEMTGKVLVKVI